MTFAVFFLSSITGDRYSPLSSGKNAKPCQEMKPRNIQEACGDGPWQKIGLDLFKSNSP